MFANRNDCRKCHTKSPIRQTLLRQQEGRCRRRPAGGFGNPDTTTSCCCCKGPVRTHPPARRVANPFQNLGTVTTDPNVSIWCADRSLLQPRLSHARHTGARNRNDESFEFDLNLLSIGLHVSLRRCAVVHRR